MIDNPALCSDLQELMNKYIFMREKISALHLFSTQQQLSKEFQRKQLEKIKNELKHVLCYWMEEKTQYKISLTNLEKENKELKYALANIKSEHDRTELVNNIKVSTLQDEIDFLRQQVTQLKNEYSEQLMLQERRHKDEISKYKQLVEDANTKLFPKQNVKKGKKEIKGNNKSKMTEKHPAFGNEKSTRSIKQKSIPEESGKIIHKKRKLFHEDTEIPIDIF